MFTTFFFPTLALSPDAPFYYLYSVFGRFPRILSLHFGLAVLVLWLSAWALLWGKRDSERSKLLRIGSWSVPAGLAYAWIVFALGAALGVGGGALITLVLAPLAAVAVLAPQLFVWELADPLERKIGLACAGTGVFALGSWILCPVWGGARTAAEGTLPLYFGLLAIEHLRLHLRLNHGQF